MTDQEALLLYKATYKQANAPKGPAFANPVPWRDRIRAFLSRRPASVINAAGNQANPSVPMAQPAVAPVNNLQWRNRLLAGK